MELHDGTPLDSNHPTQRHGILREARAIAEKTGGSISLVGSPEDAVTGASIVYTDVWASMGQEGESAVRKKDFAGFQVNEQLLELAEPQVRFMHDMPAHRGEEISEGMMDDRRAVVFDQAENRLYAQAGLLDFLFSEGPEGSETA